MPHDPDDPAGWMLVADHRTARLMQRTLTPHRRVRVEEHAVLREAWEETEHGRPSPRVGKQGHSYASRSHEEEERLRRFASSVAEWVGPLVGELGIERLDLIAKSHVLGALRSALPAVLLERTAELALDLAHLESGALARHPRVAALALPETG